MSFAFGGDLRAQTLKVQHAPREVFQRAVALLHESIVEGSELTGAPGQPVDTGYLKNSWMLVFDTPTSATISTNVVYAESIEDGRSYAHGGAKMQLRSAVGGFHSVALSVAGFDQLVQQARLELLEVSEP